MTGQRIFLFANGDCRDREFYRRQIQGDDLVICVDGGSRHVLAMGIRPFALVGDNDSLDPEVLRQLDSISLERVRDPALDQEQSDLEMALHYALQLRPAGIIICGALGGTRVDHTLANLLLLMIPFRAGVRAKIIDEHQTVRLMDRELVLPGHPGDYLSLLSVTAETRGVYTKGLKYPLYGETLYLASTRGLSNELTSETARITATSGLLLAVHTTQP